MKRIWYYIGNIIGIIPVDYSFGPAIVEESDITKKIKVDECEGSIRLYGTSTIKIDPRIGDRVINVLKNRHSLVISFYADLGEVQMIISGASSNPVYYKKIEVRGHTGY